MRFLLVGKQGDNPSTRYRLLPLARRLEQLGHEVRFAGSDVGLMGKLRLLQEASHSDLIVIQRKLFSRPFLRLLHARCKQVVYDFDDAVFTRSDGSASWSRKRRFAALGEFVSLFWAGNSYLAEVARESGRSAVVLPTPVHAERYSMYARKHEVFTLVWIGSRSTSRYLEQSRAALELVGQTCPDVQLKIIGDFELSFEHLAVVNVPWSSATEVDELLMCHVGIAPMVDDAWTRGKCALKVLQYMAAGLPVISARVGANATVVQEGVTGLFANSPDEWVTAVQRLRDDKHLCGDYSRAAREVVRRDYDTGVVVQQALLSLRECGLLALEDDHGV